MIVISHHLKGKLPIPKNAVIRVNLAWYGIKEARSILKKETRDIFLDYPSGRIKFPKPTIKFEEAIGLANEFNVKYFAFSNCEGLREISKLKKSIKAKIVPKIETVKGVKNLVRIAREVEMIMLDKYDLWVDCGGKDYDLLLEKVRSQKIKVLELGGVVFYDFKGKKQ